MNSACRLRGSAPGLRWLREIQKATGSLVSFVAGREVTSSMRHRPGGAKARCASGEAVGAKASNHRALCRGPGGGGDITPACAPCGPVHAHACPMLTVLGVPPGGVTRSPKSVAPCGQRTVTYCGISL